MLCSLYYITILVKAFHTSLKWQYVAHTATVQLWCYCNYKYSHHDSLVRLLQGDSGCSYTSVNCGMTNLYHMPSKPSQLMLQLFTFPVKPIRDLHFGRPTSGADTMRLIWLKRQWLVSRPWHLRCDVHRPAVWYSALSCSALPCPALPFPDLT